MKIVYGLVLFIFVPLYATNSQTPDGMFKSVCRFISSYAPQEYHEPSPFFIDNQDMKNLIDDIEQCNDQEYIRLSDKVVFINRVKDTERRYKKDWRNSDLIVDRQMEQYKKYLSDKMDI